MPLIPIPPAILLKQQRGHEKLPLGAIKPRRHKKNQLHKLRILNLPPNPQAIQNNEQQSGLHPPQPLRLHKRDNPNSMHLNPTIFTAFNIFLGHFLHVQVFLIEGKHTAKEV
jgi:hypothetical protein